MHSLHLRRRDKRISAADSRRPDVVRGEGGEGSLSALGEEEFLWLLLIIIHRLHERFQQEQDAEDGCITEEGG